MPELHFEDLTVGQTFETAAYTITAEEAIAFGRRYVPMPYHTDPEQAKAYPYGGLIVPGHLTGAIAFGLFVRLGLFDQTAQGAPGITLRWVRPVRPGDTIRVVATVLELSPAKAAGGRDAFRLRLDTYNQKDELVLVHESWQFIRRRGAPPMGG
jgi:acyl dehydratase